MQMRIQFCFFLIVLGSSCLAQNENTKWYFGENCGLDMVGGVTTLTNSAIWAPEGCASIADAGGNLLFYTNGVDIWNKNHQVMANGSGLMGHPSTKQSSFIVKKPASANVYYVFTLGTGIMDNLYYSQIDMSLAAGLGSVTAKNIQLDSNYVEAMHGVRHCNQSDFWIVVHKQNSSDYCSFLVSSAGVIHTPVISTAGKVRAGVTGMKISPWGKKIGFVADGVEIGDFDPSTGIVSNIIHLDSMFANSCEFSSDGTKFYVKESSSIGPNFHQWDLCVVSSSLISASHQSLSTSAPTVIHGDFQLGPDQKIYVAAGGKKSISVINNPNAAGVSCNFVPLAVSTGTGVCRGGLPNFMGPRQKAVFSHTTACQNSVFSFTPPNYCALSNDSITSVRWNFGDPASGAANASTLKKPVHAFSANGTYTVSLITEFPCFNDTIRSVVTVDSLPTLSVTGKSAMCKNDVAVLSAGGANSYSWSTGQQTNTLSVKPATTTVYMVTGTGSNSCASFKTLTVTVNNCLGMQEAPEMRSFRIYPNPGAGLYYAEPESRIKLAVYNSLGQKVRETDIHTDKFILDLSELPAGVYLIRNLLMENDEQVIIKH
jgi:hypothetical protein